jgi:acetyl esterase/lipase
VRWVREHADSLGIDPDKIITLGSSAGGHLAAAVASVREFENEGENTEVSSMPNAVVACWPVLDITIHFTNLTAVEPERVSPSHTLHDSMPPTLIMSGSEDPYNAGNDSFTANAASFSFDSEYLTYPGAGHDFGLRSADGIDQPTAGEDSVKSWTMAFLEEHNLLPVPITGIRLDLQHAEAGGLRREGYIAFYNVLGQVIGRYSVNYRKEQAKGQYLRIYSSMSFPAK